MYSECDEIAQSIYDDIKLNGDIKHSRQLAKDNYRGLILYVNQIMPDENNIITSNVSEALRELLLTHKE